MKKRNVLFAVASIATLLLSACGSSKANESREKSDGEFSGVSLVYWSNWDAAEPQGAVIKEAVQEFEKETGAKVDLQFKGRSGIKQGLIPALDANQKIDLVDGSANKSNLEDRIINLEDLVKKNDYEKSTSPIMMEMIRNYYSDGLLKEIPYQFKLNGFLYNKALFEEAGIKSAPKTEKEFVEDCAKLKKAGITPITTDDAYAPQMFTRRLERFMGDDTKYVALDNDWSAASVKDSATFFQNLAAKGYFSEYAGSNVWPTGQNTEFAAGKAAIYCAATFIPNEVKTIVGDDFEWGFFPYPEVEGGINGPEAMAAGCQSFSITSQCENQDAAFALIEKITRGEWDKKLSDMTLGIPTDVTNTDWPEELADVKPYLDNMTTLLGQSGSLESNPDVTPILKENLMKLYSGAITSEEFVVNMQEGK